MSCLLSLLDLKNRQSLGTQTASEMTEGKNNLEDNRWGGSKLQRTSQESIITYPTITKCLFTSKCFHGK